MSVLDGEKIDFIHGDPQVGVTYLTIADHLNWADEGEAHLLLLQQKLNTYLRYVETGELYQDHPQCVGIPVVFRVLGQHHLSEEASRFYRVASDFIESAGYRLAFVHSPE